MANSVVKKSKKGAKKRPQYKMADFSFKMVNFDTVPVIGNGIIKFGSDENNFFLQIF